MDIDTSKLGPHRDYVLARRAKHDAAEIRFLRKSKEPAKSSAEEEGEGTLAGNSSDLIEPRHSPETLTRYIESASELGPVIQAIVSNTIGYGYRLVPREHASKNAKLLKRESIELENLFEYANSEQDLKAVLETAAWDYFLTGNAYLEIARDTTGKPSSIWRVPAYQMRISKPEEKPHRFTIKQIRRTPKGYAVHTSTENKKFRRYAQKNRAHRVHGGNDAPIWFKEFQDPRDYDRATGKLVEGAEAEKLRANGGLAHEIVHIASPIRRGPYGLPYYIGNIDAVNGEIEASNVNLTTLRNNNIPSMILSVSGGQLTPGSIERVADFSESQIQNRANRSRFLLLESETLDDDSLDTGRSRINVVPLSQTQQNDAMFQNYTDECNAAVRRAFRLPQILIGRGDAASGVVVAASMKLADEQIFSQERARFSDWINRRLLPELGVSNWVFQLNSPNATDPATLVNMLTTAEKTGGLTPKIAREVMGEVLSRDLGDFPEGFDSDLPFSLSMAEAVKKINDAGENNPDGSNEPDSEMNGADPTEPTQQFTSNRAGDGSGSS